MYCVRRRAALLVDLAAEHGMSPADSLDGTPLTRSDLDDLDAEVRLRDELQVITNILGRCLEDVPDLGIEAGLRCHAAPRDLGLALMSSRTLADAMSVGLSLAALSFCLCRLSISGESRDGSVRLILDPSALPIHVRRFAVGRDSTGIQTLQRDLVAPARSNCGWPTPCSGHQNTWWTSTSTYSVLNPSSARRRTASSWTRSR